MILLFFILFFWLSIDVHFQLSHNILLTKWMFPFTPPPPFLHLLLFFFFCFFFLSLPVCSQHSAPATVDSGRRSAGLVVDSRRRSTVGWFGDRLVRSEGWSTVRGWMIGGRGAVDGPWIVDSRTMIGGRWSGDSGWFVIDFWRWNNRQQWVICCWLLALK